MYHVDCSLHRMLLQQGIASPDLCQQMCSPGFRIHGNHHADGNNASKTDMASPAISRPHPRQFVACFNSQQVIAATCCFPSGVCRGQWCILSAKAAQSGLCVCFSCFLGETIHFLRTTCLRMIYDAGLHASHWHKKSCLDSCVASVMGVCWLIPADRLHCQLAAFHNTQAIGDGEKA